MTEAIESPAPPPVGRTDRPAQPFAPIRQDGPPSVPGGTDQDGWALLLIPTTICLVMFVVAFWW